MAKKDIPRRRLPDILVRWGIIETDATDQKSESNGGRREAE